MEIYKLLKPIEWDGKVIKELKIDFDNLTVPQLEQAERETAQFYAPDEGLMGREADKRYFAGVIAAASNTPIQAIRSFKVPDYLNVTMMAKGFLFFGDLETAEQEGEKMTQTTEGLPKTK